MNVVKTGKTKEPYLALCNRDIWLLTAHWDIDLTVKHVAREKNIITDTLSRLYSPKPVNHGTLSHILISIFLRDQVDVSLTYICDFRSLDAFGTFGMYSNLQNC